MTGPLGTRTQKFLRDFLEHCARGKNAANGKIGTPLDYIGFHAKGSPRVIGPDGKPVTAQGQLPANSHVLNGHQQSAQSDLQWI